MQSTPYFVYILKTGAGLYYTGIAKDIESRLAQHRAGCGAKFTKGRGPLKLVYVEEVGDLKSAMRRERRVKGLPRQKKKTLIQEFARRTRHGMFRTTQT